VSSGGKDSTAKQNSRSPRLSRGRLQGKKQRRSKIKNSSSNVIASKFTNYGAAIAPSKIQGRKGGVRQETGTENAPHPSLRRTRTAFGSKVLQMGRSLKGEGPALTQNGRVQEEAGVWKRSEYMQRKGGPLNFYPSSKNVTALRGLPTNASFVRMPITGGGGRQTTPRR